VSIEDPARDASDVWRLARTAAGAGDCQHALDIIRQSPSDLRVRDEWRLFEVHQLGLMDRHIETLDVAEPLIASLLLRAQLDATERYFLAFAQWYAQVAFRSLYPRSPWPTIFDLDMNSIKLSEVHMRWKRAFPLKLHPDWEADFAERSDPV